jgi:hypothetical protein
VCGAPDPSRIVRGKIWLEVRAMDRWSLHVLAGRNVVRAVLSSSLELL